MYDRPIYMIQRTKGVETIGRIREGNIEQETLNTYKLNAPYKMLIKKHTMSNEYYLFALTLKEAFEKAKSVIEERIAEKTASIEYHKNDIAYLELKLKGIEEELKKTVDTENML